MPGLIHVGSNDASELLANSYDHLVLIEPQYEAFQRLKKNFGDLPNVHCIRCAIGNTMGWVRMHKAYPDYSTSILPPVKHLELMPHIKFEGYEDVRIYRLDDIMMYVPGEYDQLLIDVQGYELEVLKGATETLKYIRHIKCEVNTDEVYQGCAKLDEIDAYLSNFRRVKTDLYGDVWGDAEYLRISDQ